MINAHCPKFISTSLYIFHRKEIIQAVQSRPDQSLVIIIRILVYSYKYMFFFTLSIWCVSSYLLYFMCENIRQTSPVVEL